MFIYRTGLIGEAVRSRIESARSGEHVSESFGETLKSMMEQTNTGIKTVGAASAKSENHSARAINGDTLMYAMRNSDTDTTASAVLGSLGLGASSADNSVKTAADNLSAEIKTLNSLIKADSTENEAQIKTELSNFAEKYNTLLNVLGSSNTSSGIMYSNILKMSASSAKEKLSDAGITIRGDNRLEFSAQNYISADISAFLNGITSAASSVSEFSASISQGTVSGLFGNDENEGGSVLSSYYSALTGLYI